MIGKFSVLAACLSLASGQICTRDFLKAEAAKYVAAQTEGKVASLTANATVAYTEDFKASSLGTGILSKALKVDFTRSLYDTTACAIFTEIVAASNTPPYVLGTQLRYSAEGVLTKVETLATTTGDWFFNAANTLKYSKEENWGEIPADKRDTREAIKAAGDAYMDLFNDKTVKVPWGSPCARLEGGTYMQPDCNVGVPSGLRMTDRRYVIDEVVGAVDIFLAFGGNIPDSHAFRLEGGKIRYVHTLTIM
ncbi:hypothetical protein B0T14DRAFT_580715 [Immersiella caudata]|uniref:DUF8021 domain-containing protein n=1 Tax=Immersiella caudata TaxID=314043 RepID=A0AA39WVT5_9PEZI|nr:hypothetical protein B0T14DRAFT_580715 [Immersiella caudata]